jgi:hypothetical protein
MTPETPIACSLSSEELPKRLDEIRAIGRDALIDLRPDGVLRFRAGDQTRERLEAIIAAESRCCSFLRFELVEEPGALALTVTGPDGAEPLARDLVSSFAAGREAA